MKPIVYLYHVEYADDVEKAGMIAEAARDKGYKDLLVTEAISGDGSSCYKIEYQVPAEVRNDNTVHG